MSSGVVKIKVCASLDKEYMYDVGKRNGLSEKAADYFKYFGEAELNLEVDIETGEVINYEKGEL